MTTLFEMKQNLSTIGQQVAKIDTDLTAKAVDPQATREDIKALQDQKLDMQARFDVLKAQHDAMEKEQAARFAEKPKALGETFDPKERQVKAKAELIKAALRNQQVDPEVYATLGDRNTPASGGENLLPKTVSNGLILEPLARNPLRDIITVTNITNLEIPKVAFTLDDDDFIADTETAKELAATGSLVSFGRFKFKVFSGISETVLNGTETNLVASVENALRSGIAAKEKKVMFATAPKVGEEHMSFYSTQNAVVRVTGSSTYNGIKAALAALHEDYRENATIVMSYSAYLDMLETLANSSTTLFGVQPETIFGKPIVFTDAATLPIVGDFSYSHLNYDLGVLYDRDKNVRTGIEDFVITAWLDHRLKLTSAFRIVEVTPAP